MYGNKGTLTCIKDVVEYLLNVVMMSLVSCCRSGLLDLDRHSTWMGMTKILQKPWGISKDKEEL